MPRHAERRSPAPSPASVLLGTVFSLSLAISLFAAGFAVCTLPSTTNLLSRLFSDFGTSAYTPSDTTELAVATRDFSVEPYAKGLDHSTAILAEKILAAAQHSSTQDSIKANEWEGVSIPHSQDAVSGMYMLAEQGKRYSLGENEVSHLVDCNQLINSIVPFLVVIAVVALASGAFLGARFKSRALGRALCAAPAILLASMLALGAWALIDFSGFFASFHGIFFPQGNWTFPYDSLLICMLPTPFWIGMATVWLDVTALACLASILIGLRLARR